MKSQGISFQTKSGHPANCLDPDQDRHSVDPNLGPNCLQKLSVNDRSGRQEGNS